MPAGSEIAALLVVLTLVLVAATVVRVLVPFLVNAVVGLAALLVAEIYLGLEVAVTALALVIVALGGLPGAALVLLLSVFDVAFVA